MVERGRHNEKTVLFLCTGNYYRSRFAEVLFNSVAVKMGLPWRASSRGLALERGVNHVGPMAVSAIWALEALAEEPPNDYAWTGDSESLEKRIEHRATHLRLDHKADRERIIGSVLTTMQDEQVWNGVQRIAAALTRMGSISGKQAEQLFKE